MCLKITPTGAALTVRLQNTEKPIKVFKALTLNGYTYYQYVPWDRKGKNVATGPLASLGAREVEAGALHAFRTMADAQAWKKRRGNYREACLVTAYVLPQHLVAIGRFNRGNDSICATVMFGTLAAARRYAKENLGNNNND